MAYPSTFSAFTYPTSSDRLNNPSHSALHNTTSSAVGQLEAVVGLSTSSAVGTLYYDIRSPDSNGGGHIQTANKGGTGQTSYAKGDLLVATSSSVLAKLAVGSVNGAVLKVSQGAAAGVAWSEAAGSKVAVNSSTVSFAGTVAENVVFSASIIGSTLGTNNAIRFKGAISTFSAEQNSSVLVNLKYGNNTVVPLLIPTGDSNTPQTQGYIQGMLVANTTDSSQKGLLEFFTAVPETEIAADTAVGITKIVGMATGTSSVVSSANQNLIISVKFSAVAASSIVGQFFVVESIT